MYIKGDEDEHAAPSMLARVIVAYYTPHKKATDVILGGAGHLGGGGELAQSQPRPSRYTKSWSSVTRGQTCVMHAGAAAHHPCSAQAAAAQATSSHPRCRVRCCTQGNARVHNATESLLHPRR